HGFVRKRGTTGRRSLPTSVRQFNASIVQIPSWICVTLRFTAWPVSDVFQSAASRQQSITSPHVRAPRRFAASPIRLPTLAQIDLRRKVPDLAIASKHSRSHGLRRISMIDPQRIDPPKIEQIPIALLPTDILYCCRERFPPPRPNRPVKAPP